MENKKEQEQAKKVGFEVYSKDENSVTFKRVVQAKKRTKKKAAQVELGLPMVTVKCFENDDFKRLRKIADEIYLKAEVRGSKRIAAERLINKVVDFVIK